MPDPTYVGLETLLRVLERLGRRHRRTDPLPDPYDFPWLTVLASASGAIEAEAIALFRRLAAVDTRELNPLSVAVSGSWRLVPLVDRVGPYPYLFRLPATRWALSQVPILRAADLAVLTSNSRIAPHVGNNWGVLRAHVALVVPSGVGTCALRFPRLGIEIPWTAGEAFIFDDAFEHEAVNDRAGERLVLLVEVDRPLPPVLAALNRLCQCWYRKHPVQRGVRKRVLAAYD